MEIPFTRTAPPATEVAPGTRGPGDIDVLVAVMGAPSHVAGLDGFVSAIGPDLGTVTLARPAGDGGGDGDPAEADLACAALFVSALEPRLLVLPDASVRSLHRLVTAERARLVVVLDDPAAALDLRKLTARRRIRVVGASVRTTPRRPRPRR